MAQHYGFTPSLAGLRTDTLLDQVESDEDENFFSIRKQLFGSSEETPAPKTKKEAVQVFLRVRPRNSMEIELKLPECFHYQDGGKEMIAIAPKTSQLFKSKIANYNNCKYTFTKIFGPSVAQLNLFEETLLPSMRDFLDGQNCLVFTYGVTNSGKTYTVTGNPTNPGLLPRLLDVLFNSIQDGKLLTDVKFKPKHFSEVTYPSEQELASERALKESLLSRAVEVDQTSSTTLPVLDETTSDHDISSVSTVSKVSSNISKLSSADEDPNAGMSFEIPSQDSSTIELDDDGHYYSVWVSYAEIYNEFIYDLLGDPPIKGKPRPVLKLQEDRNHNLFIKGLREVQVNTVEEAMLLMQYGLMYRSQAGTKLNYSSSRSHAVYTVKLVKVANPNKPSNALVNRVSIVDLAGAERSRKTGASGARIKEAGQINKSLLTLGKCIDIMKHNQQLQKKGDELIVPFRESKLTRLFQNYFVGKGGKEARQGKVTMFVNISNTANVFDETIHVLKFSALTSKVVPLVKSLPGPTPLKSRTGTLPPPTPSTLTRAQTGAQGSPDSDSGSSHSTETAEYSSYKALEEMVSSLRCELREQEYKIRQEVCREFNEQLIDIEDNHSRELETQAEEIEEMYEKRMKNLQKSMKKQYNRKRRRRDDDESDDAGNADEQLRQRLEQLEERNRELEEELQLERERAAAEVHDTVETHETRVVQLNRQLADKCVELLERDKAMAGLREEVTCLKGELERVSEAESRGREVRGQMEELKVKLSDTETSAEYALAEVEILTTRISELTREKEDLTAAKNKMEDRLKKQNKPASLSTADGEHSASQPSQQLISVQSELTSIQSKLTSTQSELASLTSKHKDEKEELEAKISSHLKEKKQWEFERAAHLRETEENHAAYKRAKQDWENERTLSAKENERLTTRLATLNKALEEQESERNCLIKEKEELLAQQETFSKEKQEWLLEREALTHAQAEKIEAELLQGAHIQEKATLSAQLESLKTTHISDKAAWEQKVEQLTQAHIKEKTSLQNKIDHLQGAIDQEKSVFKSELATLKSSHSGKLEELRAALETELEGLKREQVKERTKWTNELEALKNEVTSESAKVAVKNEKIYKIESEKEDLEKEIAKLKQTLEDKLVEAVELANQKDSLSSSVKKTLREYDTTLKNQTAHIEQLERENEVAVAQTEELTQQCADLELRMSRACAAKEALASRVEELTNLLEDSRKALSQRESELLDTSDQCRAMLEEQISDLKKTCATLEHQLTLAREDSKTLQATLNEKESELLSLAKSVGGDRAEVECLSAQLSEVTKSLEQKEKEQQTVLTELKGTHQLEVAQFSIKVRELSGELEAKETELKAKKAEIDNVSQSYESEVEAVRASWSNEVQELGKKLQQADKKLNKLTVVETDLKAMKKSSQQLKKEMDGKIQQVAALEHTVSLLEETVRTKDQELLKLKISHETALQAIKDDWRKEVGQLTEAMKKEHEDPIYEELPEPSYDQPTIYDSVCDTTHGSNEAPPPSNQTPVASVIKPVEDRPHSRRSYLVAVTSSAPNQDSTLDSSKPVLPILETSSQLMEDTLLADPERVQIDATPLPLKRKRKRIMSKKNDKENANTVMSPPSIKKSKYTLRSRTKQVKEGDTTSLDSFTPTSQKNFFKHLTRTSKKKPTAPLTQTIEPEIQESESSISTRTRRKKLLKSQPQMEFVNSPAHLCRPVIAMSRKGVRLGGRLKPIFKIDDS